MDPRRIASDWLSQYSATFASANVDAFVGLLLPDGWLRDFLVFTWDLRSLGGREKVAAYLKRGLAPARISPNSIVLDESEHLAPRVAPLAQMPGVEAVEAAFAFECAHGHGHGHVRLVQDVDGAYRALTLFMELSDLVGHEELGTMPLRDDITGLPGRDMQKEYGEWVRGVETRPYVLIGTFSSYPDGVRLNPWI